MEQTDTLLNGNKIIQDSNGFMFGIDAVLLAHFALDGIREEFRRAHAAGVRAGVAQGAGGG